MNFDIHLERSKQAIIHALTSDKSKLIDEFITILKAVSSLLRTDSFDFWIKILQNTDYSEIPLTKYGIDDAFEAWQQYNPNRTTFEGKLLSTCEKLFTYWQADDLDNMQGQFYYYKDKTTNLIFKQSVFGMIEYLDDSINNITDIHFDIALVSDLNDVIKVNDLY